MPAFYCTTKLAQEKESKAREGMKMMGLNDATYYCSWITIFTIIMLYTSIAVTVVMTKMFNKNSGLAIFIFNFLNHFIF
jgi:ATP-binding cassette subfamily A (ABC1) protein 3